MAKVSARTYALVISSAALGGAAGLLVRLPKVPDENNMLGLIGALIGAAVAVIAGLIVLARQFEQSDERHLRTVRELLLQLHISGMILGTERATLDPATYVAKARRAMATAKSITRELQATGPSIAVVAQILEDSVVNAHLVRLSDAGIGISPIDLKARSDDIKSLADEALTRIKDGL